MTAAPLINLSDLTRMLRNLLYLMILAELIYGVHNWQLLGFTDDLIAGQMSPAQIDERAARLDSVGQIIGIGYLFVLALCYILSGIWIVRASKNAASLMPDSKRITPGWAVGWYFIPFANLFKPYQAMRETWNSSVMPHAAGGAGRAMTRFPNQREMAAAGADHARAARAHPDNFNQRRPASGSAEEALK